MIHNRVRFITLGCRVNQYETQGMREVLKHAGIEAPIKSNPEGGKDPVDFVIINTCTVTHQADNENRYWIRRARREHPFAKVVVTGCGVQRDRKEIEALEEVDLVISNQDKASVQNLLYPGCGTDSAQVTNSRTDYTPLHISESQGKTRAFVKIQDGCNHACSFCKVVLVRGRSRSRKVTDVLDEVKRLRDAGYRDVVFAGIQLGAYGLDFHERERVNVADVLYQASKIEGIERLRLSSIEPTDVDDELIEALASIPQCAHHLHIPIQSGDDEILMRMNRRYGRRFYIELIDKLKEKMPDFRLTADVMVGFHGETEAHFQNTIKLLKTVKPLRCHVFPYSSREGTKASYLEGPEVNPKVKKERVQILMALSEQLGAEVRRGDLGKIKEVLVENVKGSESLPRDANVLLNGLTDNFMKVVFTGELDQVGQMVPVKLLSVQGETILGSMAFESMKGVREHDRAH